MISKNVRVQLAGGQTKEVVLGGEQTCSVAQPRGWGTSCENLVRKEDGLHHCEDCGLVFTALTRKEGAPFISQSCDCKVVTNTIEWFFDEGSGNDCPVSLYQCVKCLQIYNAPHYTNVAGLLLQESAAAIRHVRWVIAEQTQKENEMINQQLVDLISKRSLQYRRELLEQLTRS